MRVPNADLGPVDTKTRYHKGCGLGVDANGCDKIMSPNYEESSLWQWVYVTSSDDAGVNPGWHRLLHLPIFPDRACDANAKQICNSHASSATSENFDLDAAVAAQFKKEMKDAEGSLGMALFSLGTFGLSMAMPGAGSLAMKLGRSAARSAIRSQIGNKVIETVQGSPVIDGSGLETNQYFAARVRRHLADAPGQRRLTYIGEDGVFNLVNNTPSHTPCTFRPPTSPLDPRCARLGTFCRPLSVARTRCSRPAGRTRFWEAMVG
jgi:hypothetical protein